MDSIHSNKKKSVSLDLKKKKKPTQGFRERYREKYKKDMSDVPLSEKLKLNKEESRKFLVHPLLQYDPDAAKWIKVMKMET